VPQVGGPGHFSIQPSDSHDISAWAAARDTSLTGWDSARIHPLTQELHRAITGQGVLPKMK